MRHLVAQFEARPNNGSERILHVFVEEMFINYVVLNRKCDRCSMCVFGLFVVIIQRQNINRFFFWELEDLAVATVISIG